MSLLFRVKWLSGFSVSQVLSNKFNKTEASNASAIWGGIQQRCMFACVYS